MNTDQLISVLSQDDTPSRPVAPRVMLWAGLALAIAGTALVGTLGIRPDLGDAMADPVVLMKWLLPLAVAILAVRACLRLSRPETQDVPTRKWLVLVGVGALSWLVVSAMAALQGDLWAQIRGNTLVVCLLSITSLSLIPLGVGMAALREGASPSPLRSGMYLGLAVGGFSAALYALHCNEDSPLFFLSWYGLGILIVGVIGAMIGRRQLRW